MEAKRVKKKVDEEDLFKTYAPGEDYQVLQAIRYLQGLNVFEKFLKTSKR